MQDRRKTTPDTKPRLRVRSRFEPLMQAVHHPVRLTVSLLIPLMLLPEISMLLKKMAGFDGTTATVGAVFLIIFLVFLPQLFVAALDCAKVSYDFHDDHLAFTESFLLREQIRVPYRAIDSVQVRRGSMQKVFGLADIVIAAQPAGRFDTRGVTHIIRDVAQAEKVAARIEQILAAYRAASV